MDVMVNVSIVSNSLEETVKGIKEKLRKAITQITEQAYEEWQNEAARKLHTTRRRYQDSLHYDIKSDTESQITLFARDKKTNWIINAIERGTPKFSIRDAVLKKAKLHTGRHMSDAQRRRMFAYLASVGRLGLPPTPFTDVPFRTKGSLEQGTPNAFRRISKNTPPGKWHHPGFKPVGKGGPGPLRPAIIEYIKKTADDVLQKVFSKVSA